VTAPLPLPAYRGDRLDGFFEWKAIKGAEGEAAICDCHDRPQSIRDS
jgi:hypothetical protein